MKAQIEGDVLTVSIDLHEGEMSASGKTYSVGYEQGKRVVNYKGHAITVQLNAFYKVDDSPAPARVSADVFHRGSADEAKAACGAPVARLNLGIVPDETFAKLAPAARCAICAERE